MILAKQPMITIQNKIVFFLLFFCTNSHSMVRRPCVPTRARVYVARNVGIAHRGIRASSNPPTRSYSQSPDKMLETIEKQIKQCQISEQEYLEEYSSWDTIMIDCLWNSKCVTSKCNKISNCVLNRQMAYVAWQHAQKETVFHEYAHIIAVLENTKKNRH